MNNPKGQLEFDFDKFVNLKKEEGASVNSIGNTIEGVVELTSHECNAAINQIVVDSEILTTTKEESLQEYTPEQILDRRKELLQKRKRFVQIVLDAIYDNYKTEIDALIAVEPTWQTLAVTNFDRVKIVKIVKRLGVARFIKQIVRDDKKLKELLKIKVDIAGSKKAIKDLPYIKSFLARCRVGDDRLIAAQSLKGYENCEKAVQRFQIQKNYKALEHYRAQFLNKFEIIEAKHFQKIQQTLDDYRVKVLEEFKTVDGKKITDQVQVNGKSISLKNTLQKPDLRNEIVKASNSITDLESFRDWLKTNFSLEQVSIENSDENILFCVFLSSLRKIVGKKILPTKIDKIELYKSLLNGMFIPKTLRNSPFKIEALDATFIDYRDSLWKSYLNTPDFFTKYPSYYFWLKYAQEANDLNESNLGNVWGMIPGEFREQWSKIILPFEDADKLYKAFEDVQNSWIENEEAKKQFFTKYPSYYFWLKDVAEKQGLNKNHLGHVWGMIPDEFREKWSKINLSFEDADKLYTAFEKVQKSWNGNPDAKKQFFTKYPSYYFWLKYVPEAEGLNESHLGNVWGMIPGEFRDNWSYINLPFNDADKLYTAFEEVQKSWNGNEVAKAQFFTKYPSYYFWLKDVAEVKGLKKSHLGPVWGMIPDDFRKHWSVIDLPFEDADKLHAEILESSKTWSNGDSRAYMQHFAQTKLNFSYYWGLIPTSLRQKFNLEYYYPGKIDYNRIKVDSKQEFAVLRVFEEVLGYEPEVGVNFQVRVDSQTTHTFDFKIEYQEEDSHVTHFFEWHPVVVSMSGGRNDASVLDEYQDIVDFKDDVFFSYSEVNSYAQELVEQQYYNKRLELLTNKTAHDVQGNVRLTCATAGISTGGLKKNLQTLYEFLKQAKPDLGLSVEQLTSMFKGYLNKAMDYEVESA